MINWWKQRTVLKRAREMVSGTRKLLRTHRDILDPRNSDAVRAAADSLAGAVNGKDVGAIRGLVEKLEKQLENTLPHQPHSALRENIEVFLVAAIVAMGVRTFFIQPFKIPTGSMQPTLNGIIEDSDYDANTSVIGRVTDIVYRGKWPSNPQTSLAASVFDFVGWTLFGKWPVGGHCLASGDHIFVDRFTYHFRRPDRGDVVVFETGFMHDRGFDPRGGFYIKRLVAKGGDHVEITPPYLRIDGNILDERLAFQRIYSMQDGYHGYILPEPYGFPNQPRFLNARQPSNDVPPGQYLVLGDNTRSSLDGRYWGGVPDKAVVGRGVFVYWPFPHFGRVE